LGRAPHNANGKGPDAHDDTDVEPCELNSQFRQSFRAVLAGFSPFDERLVWVTAERASLPELRWFWSITVYVDPKRGVLTFGRGSTIEEAKPAFLSSWERVRL
jgi:hypothetical protein